MTAPIEIERYVRSIARDRDIGAIKSWRSVPILHLGPDGRGSLHGQRFERFRLEFTSGTVFGGVLCPDTAHFALQGRAEDEALSSAIARAEELRDPDSDVAVFEAADYRAVGVLYLSGDAPFAVTVKPRLAEGVPLRQVLTEAYPAR